MQAGKVPYAQKVEAHGDGLWTISCAFWSRGKWSVVFLDRCSQGINYVNTVARLSGVV